MKFNKSKILDSINLFTNKIKNRQPVYLGNNTLLLYTNYGFYIYLDGRDDSLTPHIINNGVWESHISKYITSNLKSGDTFIDIGANNGFHSLLAAKQMGADGTVIAYEPQEQLCALLERSMRANLIGDRFVIRRQALGDMSGSAKLGKFANFSGSATLTNNQQIIEYEDVSMDRLDNSLAALSRSVGRKIIPTLIKIDAEGFEYRIWCGMKEMIRDLERIRIISEFSPVSYRDQKIDPRGFLNEFTDAGLRIQIMDKRGSLKDVQENMMDILTTSHKQFDLVLSK